MSRNKIFRDKLSVCLITNCANVKRTLNFMAERTPESDNKLHLHSQSTFHFFKTPHIRNFLTFVRSAFLLH